MAIKYMRLSKAGKNILAVLAYFSVHFLLVFRDLVRSAFNPE